MSGEATPRRDLEVVAIKYGTVAARRSQVFLNYADYGRADGDIEIAYYVWVVRGDGVCVVVDTGFDESVGARRGRTTLVPVPEALAAHGVGSTFAGEIVLTHAHYDHIGNVDHFPRARFTMARAEYEFWTSREAGHHLFATLVETREIAALQRLRDEGRLRLVDTDVELTGGVRVVHAPGHTPGQLMVDVDAGVGRILLTSDAVHFDEELDADMPFRHMCDLPASYRTYDAIRASAASGSLIVAGHEPAVASRYSPAGVSSVTIGRRSPIAG